MELFSGSGNGQTGGLSAIDNKGGRSVDGKASGGYGYI